MRKSPGSRRARRRMFSSTSSRDISGGRPRRVGGSPAETCRDRGSVFTMAQHITLDMNAVLRRDAQNGNCAAPPTRGCGRRRGLGIIARMSSAFEPKALFRKFDAMCATLDAAGSPPAFFEHLAPRLARELDDSIGLLGAELFENRSGQLVSRRRWGESAPSMDLDLGAMFSRFTQGLA